MDADLGWLGGAALPARYDISSLLGNRSCILTLSSAGVVRAPLLTTLMQVASRFLLVWAIVDVFPFLALSPFYSSMLIAWSVTEIIRYSFFALSLSGFQPKFLTWLRYNTFFVLYPVGIFSECALIWLATEPAGHINEMYKWALYGILAIYVPGKLSKNVVFKGLITNFG